MKCAVLNCQQDSSVSQGIEFYSFPTEPHLRLAWLEALGQAGCELAPSSVVCSDHCPAEGATSAGPSRVPTDVKVCWVCLARGRGLRPVRARGALGLAYHAVTGLTVEGSEAVCAACARRLLGGARFRRQARRAHEALLQAVAAHGKITRESLKSIENLDYYRTNLAITHCRPDHYDLVVEHVESGSFTTDTCGDTKLNDTVDSVYVKVEEYVETQQPLFVDTSRSDPCSPPCDLVNAIKSEAVYERQENDEDKASAPECSERGACIKKETDGAFAMEITRICEGQTNDDCHKRRDIEDKLYVGDGSRRRSAATARAQAAGGCAVPRNEAHSWEFYPYRETYNQMSDSQPRDREIFIYKTNESDPMNSTHSGDKPYSCTICSKLFKYRSCLQRHLKIHSNENPYSCEVCKKTFISKTHLQNHIRMHTGEKPFGCNICKKTFKQKTHLQNHLITHNGERPYSCHVCSKSFSRKSHLQVHSRIHSGNKPFLCHLCEKAFNQKSNLQNHLRTHSNEKPYFCHICGKSYSQKGNHQIHLKTHLAKEKAKPHRCPVCKKGFAQKTLVRNHLRIHTGEKPYVCDICKKAFNQRSHLKDHLRIHSGEKPYSCDICKKAFNLKSNLQKHSITHSTDKPFSCHRCGKVFNQKSHLQNHLKTPCV